MIGGQETIKQLREERDALAAHVERWKQWLGQDVEDDAGDWMDEGWSIANEAPATSLARLKAGWLKDIKQQSRRVRNYSAPDQVFVAIPLIAIDCELRRQAEGGDK